MPASHRIGLDTWADFRDILPLLGVSRFSASRLGELLPGACANSKLSTPALSKHYGGLLPRRRIKLSA